MSSNEQFVRVIYKIRRPPRLVDDAKVMINARKTIQRVFNKYIVPFDLHSYSWVTIENTGFRIRPDNHDYNSYRIDVNLKEMKGDMLDVFLSPTSLAFQCLQELEKSNDGRPLHCYVSFELVNLAEPKSSNLHTTKKKLKK